MPLDPNAPELRAHVDQLAELGVLPPPPWWATIQSLGFDKAFEDLGIVSSDWWHKNVTWENLCKNYDKESGEVRDVVSWSAVDANDIVRLSDGNCYSRSKLRDWADSIPGGLTLLPLSQTQPTAADFELLDLVDIARWKKGEVAGDADLAKKFAREKDYHSLFLLAAEFARSFEETNSSIDLQSLNSIISYFPTELKEKAVESLYKLHPKLKRRIEKHKMNPNLLLWQAGQAKADASFAPLLKETGDYDSLLKLAVEFAENLQQSQKKEDFETLQDVVEQFPRSYRIYVANTLNQRVPGIFQTIRQFSYDLTPSIDVLKYTTN